VAKRCASRDAVRSLHRTPCVLQLHLKRFDTGGAVSTKISHHIKFPETLSVASSTMSTEEEAEEEEQEEEEEKEEEEIPGVSHGSPWWKVFFRGRGSKNNSSVLLLRDLEVTGRMMLRVPRRLHRSPIYDDVVGCPEKMGFHIESRNFWDSVDRNSCVLHMQAEWEGQCYRINQEFIRENTTYQEYCEEASHREHVFALVRRWIYSHDLGIGLHGICDGNAKEGGLAPETDKQGERVIGNRSLKAPW